MLCLLLNKVSLLLFYNKKKNFDFSFYILLKIKIFTDNPHNINDIIDKTIKLSIN